jgi:hypothetical protein
MQAHGGNERSKTHRSSLGKGTRDDGDEVNLKRSGTNSAQAQISNEGRTRGNWLTERRSFWNLVMND